MSVNMVNKDIA